KKGHTYKWRFQVRSDKPTWYYPQAYSVDSVGVHTQLPIEGNNLFFSQLKLARDAGVKLISFSAPNCWLPEKEDWSALDDVFHRIIAVHPQSLLVPRITTDAPGWWVQQHPDECMAFEKGGSPRISCVSSRLYRQAVRDYLSAVVRHLSETFPEHFAGIHPAGQNTSEWFYQNSWEEPLNGYDPATRQAFRSWLAQRGEADAATAEVPSPEERRRCTLGSFRDPVRDRRVLDFVRFQQEEMADMVALQAEVCRKASNGKKLVVFFYGYAYEFACMRNGSANSGHYGLARLLKHARDLDILCSPLSYMDRLWIGSEPIMSAAETVTCAGVLWLCEDDTRTFLDRRKKDIVQEGNRVNLQQTQQILRRNNAQELMRGFGSWWMDLPGLGWFNNAHLWQVAREIDPLDRQFLSRKGIFKPEIASIIDEESMLFLTPESAPSSSLIGEGRADFGRCGAPYGQYLLSDVLENGIDAKLQVYLSPWYLTEQQRDKLRRRISESAPSVRVWCWAPGFLTPQGTNLAAMAEVSSFTVRPLATEAAIAKPTGIGKKAGLLSEWCSAGNQVHPLFTVDAQENEVWARYPNNAPAVAVRKGEHGFDVFVGVPRLPPTLLHALAKLAGVHLFTDAGTPVWAAENHLAAQAHRTGEHTFDIGSPSPIFDAITGRKIGDGPVLRILMEKGETRIFRW
ncbi:MAG: beta-galactosidase, partial [Kiritimatiellae bacterium]|nr:beta-galactosidase [Kiritimatiellia bacterium]